MVQAIRSLAELVAHGGTVQAAQRAFVAEASARLAARLRCSGRDGCGARRPYVAWLVNPPPVDPDPPPPRPRLVRRSGGPRLILVRGGKPPAGRAGGRCKSTVGQRDTGPKAASDR